MGNDLSLDTVGDVVREKVKKVIFDSMPQDKLDEIIKKQCDDFFKPHYWGDLSKFETLIQEAATTLLKSLVVEYVNKNIPQQYTGASEQVVCEVAKRLASSIQQAIIEGQTQFILNAIRQNNERVY